MTPADEFEKAKSEFLNMRFDRTDAGDGSSCHYGGVIGATWARQWTLTQDPLVLSMRDALRDGANSLGLELVQQRNEYASNEHNWKILTEHCERLLTRLNKALSAYEAYLAAHKGNANE